MNFLFFGTSLALLEAELCPFKDWEEISNFSNSRVVWIIAWSLFYSYSLLLSSLSPSYFSSASSLVMVAVKIQTLPPARGCRTRRLARCFHIFCDKHTSSTEELGVHSSSWMPPEANFAEIPGSHSLKYRQVNWTIWSIPSIEHSPNIGCT